MTGRSGFRKSSTNSKCRSEVVSINECNSKNISIVESWNIQCSDMSLWLNGVLPYIM